MCCCGKPVVNGEPGYSWDGKTFGVYPVNPPPLEEHEALLFDEPGRCNSGSGSGGLDSHCHHYRVTLRFGTHYVLFKHGGGHGRFRLSGGRMVVDALRALDSNARYWTLNAMFHAQWQSASDAREATAAEWRKAAAEKRIKTRKVKGGVKVWVEDRPAVAMA